MIRFLAIIALIYGLFWCYNNNIFNFSKDSAINSMKNAKIIKTVNDGRAQVNDDVENVNNSY